ncbi:MAG TPA: ornithine cyclodeaminase family protein [Streptosporangiaceae bacterium]
MSVGAGAQATAEFPAIIGAGLLRSLVPMADAIEASRRAFAAAAAGEVTGPLRSSLSRERVLIMPAEHSSGSGLIKVISVQPDGWPGGQPSIGGSVLWIDGPTGRIAALVDAAALTSLRTGAASGLASQLLARPASRVLAMLGAGGQAADQVAGVCAARPISEVLVYSRRRERSEELCGQLEASHPGLAARPARSPAEAVAGADVICAATRATEPLFQPADLRPDAHVNAVGAYRLDMREIPAQSFGQAAIVVIDQLAAALAEAGDLVAALDAGYLRRADLVEIGSLVTGGAVTPAGGLTIFKSVGIAAQDWSVCELAVRRARQAGAIPGDDGLAGRPGAGPR